MLQARLLSYEGNAIVATTYAIKPHIIGIFPGSRHRLSYCLSIIPMYSWETMSTSVRGKLTHTTFFKRQDLLLQIDPQTRRAMSQLYFPYIRSKLSINE